MAEALARHAWGEELEVASAGLHALGHIPVETLKVLEEIGVSTQGLYSKDLSGMDLGRYHFIVNLADYNLEGVIPSSFKGRLLQWRVRDPYFESVDAFRQTRDAIEWLILEKLPKWIEEV
jgi:ArsR family transcriptional regulator